MGVDEFRSFLTFSQAQSSFQINARFLSDIGLEYTLLLARPQAELDDPATPPPTHCCPEELQASPPLDALGVPAVVEALPSFSYEAEQARLTYLWRAGAMDRWEMAALREHQVLFPELERKPELLQAIDAILRRNEHDSLDAATQVYTYLEEADLPAGTTLKPRTSPSPAESAPEFVKLMQSAPTGGCGR